jgi:DNA-binding NarL/FixJ family response regulator
LWQLTQSAPDVYLVTLALTAREHEMLEAYALGLSNQETTIKLSIFDRSVQTYNCYLQKKMSINNQQRAL